MEVVSSSSTIVEVVCSNSRIISNVSANFEFEIRTLNSIETKTKYVSTLNYGKFYGYGVVRVCT